jgi:hypothetical protein
MGPLAWAVTPVAVTPGVSNTPGAWTEIAASTTGEAEFLQILWTNTATSAAAVPFLLDVAVGAAASEVAIISSICVGGATAVGGGSGVGNGVLIPVFVQPGVRVSVRLTTSAASTALTPTVGIYGFSASAGTVANRVLTIGANTAASTGQAVTGTGWSEITASTAEPFRALVLTLGVNDAVLNNQSFTISLGVGLAGVEVEIGQWYAGQGTTEVSTMQTFTPVQVHVPAGSRIAAKMSFNNTFTATVIGIPYA